MAFAFSFSIGVKETMPNRIILVLIAFLFVGTTQIGATDLCSGLLIDLNIPTEDAEGNLFTETDVSDIKTANEVYTSAAQKILKFSEAVEQIISDQQVFESLVVKLRHDLNPNQGPGLSFFDLSRYLPKEVGEELFAAFTSTREIDDELGNRDVMIRTLRSKRRYTDKINVPVGNTSAPFRRLGNWLQGAINEALKPHETLQISSLELRLGSEAQNFPGWHPDNGYATMTLSLNGDDGTITSSGVRTGSDPLVGQQAGQGELLTMTGEDRAKKINSQPTSHTTPVLSEVDRVLLVVWFREVRQ